MIRRILNSSGLMGLVTVPGVVCVRYSYAQEQTVLEGTWQLITVNGVEMKEPYSTTLTFSGVTYEQAVGGLVDEHGLLRLDSARNPMTIDFFVLDENGERTLTQLGICEIDGDKLRLQLNLGSNVRPADFASTPNSVLIIAKNQSRPVSMNHWTKHVQPHSHRTSAPASLHGTRS